MSQASYNLGNQPGSSYRLSVNNAKQAAQTFNSGPGEPPETYPFMFWVDTSGIPSLVKRRNSSNSAWVLIGEIDSFGNHRYKNCLDPVDDQDLVTKSSVNSLSRLPIGHIVFLDVADNPNTLYGYGTWQKISDGKFIIGEGTHTDSRGEQRTFTLGDVSGEYQHVVTISEMPSHTHSVPEGGTRSNNTGYRTSAAQWSKGPQTTGSTGGNQPHNNLPPFLVLRVWKRIA